MIPILDGKQEEQEQLDEDLDNEKKTGSTVLSNGKTVDHSHHNHGSANIESSRHNNLKNGASMAANNHSNKINKPNATASDNDDYELDDEDDDEYDNLSENYSTNNEIESLLLNGSVNNAPANNHHHLINGKLFYADFFSNRTIKISYEC